MSGVDPPSRSPEGGVRRPLDQLRIIVTRPEEQSASFVQMLKEAGAEVVLAPMIRVIPPADPGPLADAARSVDQYDWIVLTSVNGVRYFRAAIEEAGSEEAWATATICAIGPATAEAVRSQGGSVTLIPSTHTAEGVVSALDEAIDVSGKRILLPQAAGAREILECTLSELGAEVTRVEAYRTVADRGEGSDRQWKESVREGDMVTFASASSVRAFFESAGAAADGLRIATIGPITSRQVREAGFEVDVEADPHTIEGLLASIVRYFSAAPQ